MKISYTYIAIAILLVILFFKSCESKPDQETKTETTIEYVTIIDTVVKTKIDTITKTVYVEKIKTEAGKTIIKYQNKPTKTTITANQYNTKLESNNALASLKITTTGELLDVSGVITYTQENTTIETIKTKQKSGLFIYTESSINPMLERAELGLDYQIKNKIIIGASGSYNNIAKKGYLNLKVGFRLF